MSAPVIAETPLSPSRVNAYLNCSARFHYRYNENLPDPPSGSLVRGRAVHQLVNYWFKFRMEGLTPDSGALAEAYDEIWEREAEGAAFGVTDDIDEMKVSGAQLAAKYLAEAAPDIEPAALDVPVEGVIGGVAVRGYVDLLDASGRIIDLKTAKRKPSAVSPDYALQVATYAQLAPQASGEVRVDTVVDTKVQQLVTISYQVPDADKAMCERMYPHVKRCMDSGVYVPNRNATFCSRRHCSFADQCAKDFGGVIPE